MGEIATHINVQVQEIKPEALHTRIESYGMVRPRIQSQLIAQVSGKIDYVAESFRDGGFFEKGEVLVGIEQADYRIEVNIAEANLLDAELQYQEQQALAEQAKQDWQRLGNNGNAAPLVLREPQLAAAEARVKSAKASLDGAQLNMRRTKIIAPFDGRVLSLNVDIGQVVGNNSLLGEIYATDAIEIRLPIKNRELSLLELPESWRSENAPKDNLPKADIFSELANRETWTANIVRTSGAIAADSRQLYVVARIDDPFGKPSENKMPLKINQYVTAEIHGKTIDEAIAIPNSTIYKNSYVYVYSNGVVNRKAIEIQWQNKKFALISSGLVAGDRLVTTPLGQIPSGTRVNLEGQSK